MVPFSSLIWFLEEKTLYNKYDWLKEIILFIAYFKSSNHIYYTIEKFKIFYKMSRILLDELVKAYNITKKYWLFLYYNLLFNKFIQWKIIKWKIGDNMNFRKAVKSDINEIMRIIKQAQNYFKENGINQWQDNYPNNDIINNDIINNNSYVVEKNENIIATIAVSFEKEIAYNNIYQGQWISNESYAVIHRIAIDNMYKGLGLSHKIIKFAEEICIKRGVKSIKVDTHKQNLLMQKLLEKNQFKYCGIIYLKNNEERVAFEKKL